MQITHESAGAQVRALGSGDVDLGLLGIEWDGSLAVDQAIDLAGSEEPGDDQAMWSVYAGQVDGEVGRVGTFRTRVVAVAFAAGIVIGAHPSAVAVKR